MFYKIIRKPVGFVHLTGFWFLLIHFPVDIVSTECYSKLHVEDAAIISSLSDEAESDEDLRKGKPPKTYGFGSHMIWDPG